MLNQWYLVLKGKEEEAEQIRKSIYSILRQEQREQAQRGAQDMEQLEVVICLSMAELLEMLLTRMK